MMRKFLGVFVMLILPLAVSAQKKQEKAVYYTTVETTAETDIDEMEVRMCDVISYVEFKPLVAELQMLSTSMIPDSMTLTKEKLMSLDGNLDNVRKWAAFEFAWKHQADVVIGASFDIHIPAKGNGRVRMKGIPAKFKNLHTMSDDDLEWIVKLRNSKNQ